MTPDLIRGRIKAGMTKEGKLDLVRNHQFWFAGFEALVCLHPDPRHSMQRGSYLMILGGTVIDEFFLLFHSQIFK
jgi:hypothetical protein